MSGIGDLLGGGDAVRQILLWQVFGQLLAPVLAPVQQEISNQVWPHATDVPLAPAEAADAVVRGVIDQNVGASEAAQSGISGETFDRMVRSTGDAPGIMQLLEAFRRQIIDEGRLHHGIRQSRLKDEWTDVIEALRTAPLSPADAVAATVQNQVPRGEGEHLAYLGGMSAQDFAIAVNTHGRPPGPMELLEMARRGIIGMGGTGPGATTVEQGIAESDVKDKWIPALSALYDYLPPPRTVTALLRSGSITEAQAAELFRKAGLSAELAAAYVASAAHAKAAPQHHLAQSTITELYSERAIDAATATQLLAELGQTAEHAHYILELVDVRRHMALVKAATSRVGALYLAHRIERADALRDLQALKLPADQVDALLVAWDLERAASLRVLSEATIAQAWHYAAIDDAEAMAELQALGYTPYDAWVYLAAHNKGAGPGPKPAKSDVHGVL